MNMGNVLYVLDRLKPQRRFLNNLRNFYGGEVYPMNFKRADQAQIKINKHVAERTNGKIKDLINNLDPLTELLLISYIYFNGKIYISYFPTSYIISSEQSWTSPFFFNIFLQINSCVVLLLVLTLNYKQRYWKLCSAWCRKQFLAKFMAIFPVFFNI